MQQSHPAVSKSLTRSVRFDTTLSYATSDALNFYGLFQFKAREPLPADDPNKDLFVNQGAGRRVGGKFKELYVRYDTWRVGKFVQNFGRAYVLLPGPFSADFIEETDQGYEPSEMLGIEKLHVFGSEKYGWQQISVSAFMVDRSPLHRSFPYDEGQIHYKDGGVGNTHLPTNVMVTYDALNVPVGHGAQATFQASAIRWGRTFGVPRGEFWTTLGGDVSIPLGNSVRKTLQRKYTEVHLYVEGARRANFQGLPGRDRNYVTEAGEFLRGPWQIDMSATQRWTTDPLMPTQQDRIYTGTIGRNFASQSLLLLSVARERVADRSGVYAGIRLVQTFTACARCARGAAY
ncbi:hypothetical protein [Sphingomonas sp. 10B4]|uniref:hypothetical protein n=1 Tax=Sphingomonas sp. 10B4 TaxID=3048575 RepID=UPI002AB3EAD6|nr:hypothetical protein [Sphingomonas sp. 10B4]MDY7523674.1 hypothetical protein [Sphingomonas sp. 10B4]MEB0284571.1 hypothetical protein [Sphingomonas sp. 10B4]